MGCGASSAASASAPTQCKDADDMQMYHVRFERMGIVKFDALLSKLNTPVDTVVDMCNDINDCVGDIKDAVALTLGAYRVEVVIGKDHDRTLLKLVKAIDNQHPTAAEVTALGKPVVVADTMLAKAAKALDKALQKTPVPLKVVENKLTAVGGPAAEVEAFNVALAALRTAVGATYLVVLAVEAAGVQGGKGVCMNLCKPVFKSPDSAEFTMQPLSVLEVAAASTAKAISGAEPAAAKAAAALAKALKALPDKEYKLTVKGKRVMVTFPKPKVASSAGGKAGKAGKDGEEEEEGEKEEEEEKEEKERTSSAAVAEGNEDDEKDEKEVEEAAVEEPEAPEAEAEPKAEEIEAGKEGAEAGKEGAEEKEAGKEGEEKSAGGAAKSTKKAAPSPADPHAKAKTDLFKAVTLLNVQVFKLSKACQNASGDVSIGRGFIEIINVLKKKVLATPGMALADINKVIKINPTVKFGDGGDLDWDLGLTVDLPEFNGLKIDAIIKKLPAGIQLVYAAVLSMKARITALVPKFGGVKDQVTDAVAAATEFFSNAGDHIKEALDGDDMNPMVKIQMIAGLVSASGTNLIRIKDCAVVAQTFMLTIKNVSVELNNTFDSLKKELAPAPAA